MDVILDLLPFIAFLERQTRSQQINEWENGDCGVCHEGNKIRNTDELGREVPFI